MMNALLRLLTLTVAILMMESAALAADPNPSNTPGQWPKIGDIRNQPDPAGTTIEVGSIWRNRYLTWGEASLHVEVIKDQRPNIFTVKSFKDGKIGLAWGNDKEVTTWLNEAEFRDSFRKMVLVKPDLT